MLDRTARQPFQVMKAAVLTGAGRMSLREVPLADPKAGQVRIALEGCGVCASNLGPWSGPDWMEFPTQPGELGHEGWGRIDAIGPGVHGLEAGERVAALTYHAYSSHDFADSDCVVKLPPAFDDLPFPGEPLGCAMNIFKRSRIEAGDVVAIVGIGFLGVLLCQLASRTGARVIAIGRRAFALEQARMAGAHDIIPMEDHWQIIEEVKVRTNGQMCDCVIEAVGKQWPLDLASELTKIRGRLIIAGYHQDGSRQVNMQQWNWRGLDVINAHERDPEIYIAGMREAVQAIVDRRLDPQPFITHTLPLEKLDDALNMTRDRPDGFMKAIVTCN